MKAEGYEWNPPFPGPLYAPLNANLDAMIGKAEEAKKDQDSVGGIIECHIDGVPKGIGSPVFDKLDALLAHAMLSIGGIKGIEFGSGLITQVESSEVSQTEIQSYSALLSSQLLQFIGNR